MFDVSKELVSVQCCNCDKWIEIPIDCEFERDNFYCDDCTQNINEALKSLRGDWDPVSTSNYPCCGKDVCEHGVPDDEHCDHCDKE